jgi:hypothetical protein
MTDPIKLSLKTESSKFAFMNLIGAVALNSSLLIPIGCIRLAPEDLGLLGTLAALIFTL